MIREALLNLIRDLKLAGILKRAEVKNNRLVVIELNQGIEKIDETLYWRIMEVWKLFKENGIRLSIRS